MIYKSTIYFRTYLFPNKSIVYKRMHYTAWASYRVAHNGKYRTRKKYVGPVGSADIVCGRPPNL